MNVLKKIIIVGAGGFGREVVWTIQDCNKISKTYSIEGFIDENKSLIGKKISGIPVLGNLDWFKNNNNSDIFCVISISDGKARERVANFLKTQNVQFVTIIHPSVIQSKSVTVGTGCVIQAGVVLTVDLNIGDHVHINFHSSIAHDCIIDDFVTISRGTKINGNTLVGRRTDIGTGVVMKQGIKIGKDVIVGAGSVLIKDIPDDSFCVGVPGQIKKLN